MNVRQDQINDLYSAKVVTRDDESLGGVGQVYLDDNTGEPSWISVKTGWFGTNESLVPLDGAELRDGTIRVAHTKETIKDAPNVDADDHLSSQHQDELFRYYGGAGMDVSRYGDRTGQTGGTDVGHRSGQGDLDRGDRSAHHGGDERRHDVGHDESMTLHEERVDVGTERVETGRVGLRKHVVTDQKTVTVPVEREEVEVVREPVAEGEAHDGARLGDAHEEVTLHEERPVVDKDVVATERVGLEKETVRDERQVTTDVAHEEVDVDRDGTDVTDDRRHDA
jgi:uncharacterized protein (TIGR02271 family)